VAVGRLEPNAAFMRMRNACLRVLVETKLVAFHGRGENDLALSHDLEDIIHGRGRSATTPRRNGGG